MKGISQLCKEEKKKIQIKSVEKHVRFSYVIKLKLYIWTYLKCI